MPSTAQLVAQYGVANATIQHALKTLKDEGFLDSRVGKGVYVRNRILFHDDRPVELSASYYPADIGSGSSVAEPRKIRGGAPRVLAELGFPQRAFVDRISARPPTVEEAEALDLPDGTPVIRQLRVVYSDAG